MCARSHSTATQGACGICDCLQECVCGVVGKRQRRLLYALGCGTALARVPHPVLNTSCVVSAVALSPVSRMPCRGRAAEWRRGPAGRGPAEHPEHIRNKHARINDSR
eukprot:3397286-Prymnesium_polylepis.4